MSTADLAKQAGMSDCISPRTGRACRCLGIFIVRTYCLSFYLFVATVIHQYLGGLAGL